MNAELVYIFLNIRGYLGSVTDKKARDFIIESKILNNYLFEKDWKMPGFTIILVNINAVSYDTRKFIQQKQLEKVYSEKIDNFKHITIDSTSVKANSSWPTDAKIIYQLLNRAFVLFQKTELSEIKTIKSGWISNWLKNMKILLFKINLTSGKKNTEKKKKKHYRLLLNLTNKTIEYLCKELEKYWEIYNPIDSKILPSSSSIIKKILKQISDDISGAYKAVQYTEGRLFNDKILKSTEKILSL